MQVSRITFSTDQLFFLQQAPSMSRLPYFLSSAPINKNYPQKITAFISNVNLTHNYYESWCLNHAECSSGMSSAYISICVSNLKDCKGNRSHSLLSLSSHDWSGPDTFCRPRKGPTPFHRKTVTASLYRLDILHFI